METVISKSPKRSTVAVEQAPRVALAYRFTVAVDVDTVAAGVNEVINSAFEIDARVTSGDVAIGVGKDPVVLQRAPDRAAFLVENADGVVTDNIAVIRAALFRADRS